MCGCTLQSISGCDIHFLSLDCPIFMPCSDKDIISVSFFYVGSCSPSSCSDHGRCYGTVGNGSKCVCDDNWFGTNCEFEGPDLCQSPYVQNCFGHGVCSYYVDEQGDTRFSCECDFGYEMIHECATIEPNNNFCLRRNNVCLNGGTCHSTVGDGSLAVDGNCDCGYTCDCPPGELVPAQLIAVLLFSVSPSDYHGVNCSVPFDACDGQCVNGDCSVIAGGHYFECACSEGFTGVHCDVAITEAPVTEEPGCGQQCPPQPSCANNTSDSITHCVNSLCSSHTRSPHCVSTGSAGGEAHVCLCAEGWGGTYCNQTLSPLDTTNPSK